MWRMSFNRLPAKQGLYDPRQEHDACGIGVLAHIKGVPSHQIVQDALEVLCRLEHRGGQGEQKTGDGSGIMLQIPHDFFKHVLIEQGVTLPDVGEYGVGMVFLPQHDDLRAAYEAIIEQIVEEEGFQLHAWRTVPTDDSDLGEAAKKTQPIIKQLFIHKGNVVSAGLPFERKLYVIRKRIENEMAERVRAGKQEGNQNGCAEKSALYFTSLSARTIVYKGLLTPEQLKSYYVDMQHAHFKSAIALVHNRFSTNTFPSWERAHPNRYLIHNGEINTLRGNVNWMNARQSLITSESFGADMRKIKPIIDESGSDSSMLDNTLEFLALSGRSLPHVAMMMIPEPWSNNEHMNADKKAFYQYHSCLMEPWDGPTSIAFTDGKQVGAILDRNGLRPGRYYVTDDDMVIYASEVGVVDVPEEKIIQKERLSPGKMLLIDTEEGRIIDDEEIKSQLATEYPYDQWIKEHLLTEADLEGEVPNVDLDEQELLRRQKAFDYTTEEIDKNIMPMVTDGVDPIGSMGMDTPLAVLSDRPQLLYNYFKQLFAQVTNPPIDAIREEIVTSTMTMIGSEGNVIDPLPESCRHIQLESPIVDQALFSKIKHNPYPQFKATTLEALFSVQSSNGLEDALQRLCFEADQRIDEGVNLLVVSDRKINETEAVIPALLAVSCLHHHLIKQGTRTKVSLIVETGEARDVHQLAMLIGYGADVIYPYLAIETVKMLAQKGKFTVSAQEAIQTYVQTATKGIVKILSKMGISTIQSYRGAQIFEAIGIHQTVIDAYFTGTVSQIQGITLDVIEKETVLRHQKAYSSHIYEDLSLESGSDFQWRHDGEYHKFNPTTIHTLQQACRQNDYETYKQFSQKADHEQYAFLRGLLDFEKREPVPIEEVESVESICRRFKTGAISYGAISKEAHESLAIAMNRIGGKSNSGEGGEEPERYTPDANGDLRRSAIKQVASGRFGVTSHYLVNADEIQIKMAQGAKPGEGGQLPGNKVYPWIAEVRGSTPGVGLISPPPHHDIYSIEDLAQLIHDLKRSNPNARINVKLVSKSGVGTIASGVAKGLADVILISGYEGGTGASPRSSIKHAGLPWEFGLAETHQTLLLNNLRDRVTLETDGKMMTGRDVAIAALLGAEEYGFSTAPLVVLGCVMMRVCQKDTCPVGIATQNPELRKKYTGDPEHIVRYMHFIAQELREIMAHLGFRTVNEMIGRTDVLKTAERTKQHWKAKHLDLSPILYQPEVPEHYGRYFNREQDHGVEHSIDFQKLIPLSQPALEKRIPVEVSLPIKNTDRSVGTLLGSKLTSLYGEIGLPEDSIKFNFSGSAGQSLGAFVPKGITLKVSGDANDYVGKGLSGGKLIVTPPDNSKIVAEKNMIIGNVAFYGATSGEAYIRGMAGERFCVRNSGVHAVVEGVGDHGCEYMTGGRVVIIGSVGKNFAAGMSGGIAYVLQHGSREQFEAKCNQEMVLLEDLVDGDEINAVKQMIVKHVQYTGSAHGQTILKHWDLVLPQFIKVIPKDFKRMVESINELKLKGLSDKTAKLNAFANKNKARKQPVVKTV